jgi:hypothetical protein
VCWSTVKAGYFDQRSGSGATASIGIMVRLILSLGAHG